MTTHGKSRTRLRRIYSSMKQRCLNLKNNSYKDYGGRGITICEQWLNDFISFNNWAMENGYEEDLTIDRINVDGNYEPSNCRWATQKEQQNNRTNNKLIESNGVNMTFSQYTDGYDNNNNITIAYTRYLLGWDEKDWFVPKITKLSEIQSGVKGVCWDKSKNKWLVTHKGKFKGRYADLNEAIHKKEECIKLNNII
jgi:hypothetical protein